MTASTRWWTNVATRGSQRHQRGRAVTGAGRFACEPSATHETGCVGSPPASATSVAPANGRHSPAQWALQSTNSGLSAESPTVTASQSPS